MSYGKEQQQNNTIPKNRYKDTSYNKVSISRNKNAVGNKFRIIEDDKEKDKKIK